MSVLGNQPLDSSPTDLEKLQTLIILVDYIAVSSPNMGSCPLLQPIIALATSICVDQKSGVVPRGVEPINFLEWLTNEMKIRAWCFAACLDLAEVRATGRQPLYDYTKHPIVMPCSENIFLLDNVVDGYNLMYRTPGVAKPFAIDFAQAMSGKGLVPEQMFLDLLGPRFGGRVLPILQHAVGTPVMPTSIVTSKPTGWGLEDSNVLPASLAATPPLPSGGSSEFSVVSLDVDL